jgi:polysaccharide export outer membrane protein
VPSRGLALAAGLFALAGASPLFAQAVQPAPRLTPETKASAPPADRPTAKPGTPAEVVKDMAALTRYWPSGRYRITVGDVLQVTFPYVPEFDQTVPVQPDGYISLRAIGDLPVQGRTLPELKTALYDAYEPILKEPVITVVLREFEKPYFVIAGEVTRPGKYDLRGATTVTEALALAGGKTGSAKDSQVLLFRRYGNDLVDVKQVDVKKMYATHNLAEDPVLRPGDTVFVPKSRLSAITPYLPKPSLGFFLNPLTW